MRDAVVYTLMFSAMLQLLMAAYAWGRRNEPAARPLILVFVLGALWAFAYGMDLSSGDLQVKMRWTQIMFTAASFGPITFLWIVLEHLELMPWLTRWRAALMLLPSALIIALMWSIPHQNLFLYDFAVERVAGLDILQRKNGILYTPIFLVLQGISIISYYFLIRSFSLTSPVRRRQSKIILSALLIPFLVNIPAILNISPIKGFDFTPQALVFSSALFAFAIFRYHWLDILPLARTALVETLPVGVVVLDAKSRIVDINPSARELLQVDNSVIGHESQAIFARFDANLEGEADMETFHKEIKIVMPIGQPRHVDIHVIPLRTQTGQFNGRILAFQDITERKQANERLQAQLTEIESLHDQLHELAIRDPLTGLFNRRYMNDVLERETRRAERHEHPLSILMIEIDDFKKFNDRFGHDAGDVTLQKVGELIQANTRTDDTACRYGGDEFVLILPEATLESARQCGERLRENASMLPLEYEGRSLGNLTLSVGVGVFPKHGNSMMLVLRAADEAMYLAKQAGKNRVVVAPE